MENVWGQMAGPAAGAPQQPGEADLLAFLQMQRPDLFAQAPAAPTPPLPTQTLRTTETSTKMSGPAGPSSAELMQQINQRELDSLRQQGLTIEGLQQQLGQAQATPGATDAEIFAMGVGDLFGGGGQYMEFAKSQVAGKKSEIEKLQAKIMSGQQNLTDNELGLLKTQLQNALGMETLDYKKEQDKIQNEFERQKLAIERAKAGKEKGVTPEKAFEMRTSFTKLEPATQARGVTAFVNALNEYERAFDAYDGNPASATGAKVRSAYQDMSTSFKEAKKLGALAGPDLKILNQNVANGGTWESFIVGDATGGRDGIKAAIAQTRRGAANEFTQTMSNLEGVAGEARPYVQSVLDDYNAAYARATGGATNLTREQMIQELMKLEGKK